MKKLALLAPVLAVALTGCAHDPTMAARVAGQSIPVSDVNVMADFLCATASAQAAQSGGSAQTVSIAQVNQSAVTYLAGAKALVDLAARNHLTVPTVSASGSDALIAKLPSSEQSRARVLVGEVESALNFVVNRLGASGGQQQISALSAVIQTEADHGRFISNPEYPPLSSNGSQSISTAISAAAKDGASVQPSASYLASLPAGQKCQ